MKTAKQILIAARQLIAKPEHWTQIEIARKPNGDGTLSTDPNAVCWCAYGAMCKVGDCYVDALETSRAIMITEVGEAIGTFNDTHTHAEVLAKFDEVIASLP